MLRFGKKAVSFSLSMLMLFTTAEMLPERNVMAMERSVIEGEETIGEVSVDTEVSETATSSDAAEDERVYSDYITPGTDFWYELIKDGSGDINIEDYRGTSETVVVPGEIDGHSVRYINLYKEQLVKNLDVSRCSKLEHISWQYSNLERLVIGDKTNLEVLTCNDSKIREFDIGICPKLRYLDCSNNNISSLNIAGDVNLEYFSCARNNICSLVIGEHMKLDMLECSQNEISSIDVSKCNNLRTLRCDINNIKELDITSINQLANLSYDEYTTVIGNTDNIKNDVKYDGINVGGIYINSSNQGQITAGLVMDDKQASYSFYTCSHEYSWLASKDSGKTWIKISDWKTDNEWINWTPDSYGDYILVCKVRRKGRPLSETSSNVAIASHPHLKGICQMPYTGEGGGYLIGMETYDNQDYSYEMQILDCSLLAQGKDAWTYTTGLCKTDSTCLWTTWQPQYGYYWTLFRIYDKNGKLIDEQCFGFQNIG